MAKRNLSGTNVGTGNARQQNQQALNNAGQNFEFSSELGAGAGAGAGMTGQAQSSTAAHARQRNQQAMQNAAAKAGRTGQ